MEAGFYRVTTGHSPIGEGLTGAAYCSLEGVIKFDSDDAAYTVANEFICARLGIAIGLPTPPGTIARTNDGKAAYVMLRFGDQGDKPPPVNPATFAAERPDLACGIVIFDDWIMNFDRHEKNLAYISNAGVSVFDHGHALMGESRDTARSRLEELRERPAFKGCLLDHVRSKEKLEQWSARIQRMDDQIVAEICDAPRRLHLLGGSECRLLIETLNYRKSKLKDHIWSSRDQFIRVGDFGATA